MMHTKPVCCNRLQIIPVLSLETVEFIHTVKYYTAVKKKEKGHRVLYGKTPGYIIK